MKTNFLDTPRCFDADGTGRFVIADIGTIALSADEQITFVAESGCEYDVTRKSWGYYATPSLNGRLPAKGLHPVLVKNSQNRYYILLVEDGRENEFKEYLTLSGMHIVLWLDERALAMIENSLSIQKEKD